LKWFFDENIYWYTSYVKTFSERVVEIARKIPKGRVTTYGRISRAAGGGAMSSQSITSILGKAYNAGITDIPFHRIVYANGTIWIDDKHRKDRMALYKKEGIEVDVKGKIKNFKDIVVEYK
jgi:methylated-DNA-protein-cysteine methyltransferase-like protein